MKANVKSKMLWVGVLLVLGTGVLIWRMLKTDGPEYSYQEIKVEKSDLIVDITASGTVSPQNRLEIKPPVAGRIEEVLANEGDVVKKGKVLAWISSTERAALLDSVRGEGASTLKRWENLYKPTPAIAPINGTVILRNVEAGQSFLNTEAIFVLADRLTVKAQVDETDISQVKVNQSALITLDAYPKNPIAAKVIHLAYDATLTNNVTTYIVDILPNEVPEFMRSGMTANVSIEVDRKDGVSVLPLSALQEGPEGKFVEIRQNGKIVPLPVTIGLDNGKVAEVLEGPLAGETVLVKEVIKAGAKSSSGSPFMPSRPGGRRK